MLFIWYPKCSTCQKAKRWLEEQLQLLASNGMLVKRPLVIDGDTVLTGFKEAEWAATLRA